MSNNTALTIVSKALPATHVQLILQGVRDRYDVHGRAFTKSDFLAICKGERITLNVPRLTAKYKHLSAIENALLKFPQITGFYTRRLSRPIIYLKCLAVRERFDIDTAFHELGHHFLGHGDPSFSGMTPVSADEGIREADADHFAELAVGIPTTEGITHEA